MASLYEDRGLQDTDQLIANGFEGEPQRKVQHHLKDQEGHVCLSGFHGFLICISMRIVHGPVTFSPTDVQGKSYARYRNREQSDEPQGGVDSVNFLVWIFNGCKWAVSRVPVRIKVSRNFWLHPRGSSRPIVCLVCQQKSRRFCQKVSSDCPYSRLQHHLQGDLPPNLWVNNCILNRFKS